MADTQQALDAALKPQGDVTVGDVAMHGDLPTDAMEAVAEIKFKRGIKGESVGSQKRTAGDTAAAAMEEALPNPVGEGRDADAPSPKVARTAGTQPDAVLSPGKAGGSGAVDITAALMEPGTQGAQEEDQEPQAADLLTSMKEGPATTPVAADTIREAAACADNDAAPPAADLQAAAADPNSVAGSGIGAGSASYAASLQDAANDKDETAAGSGYADDDDTAGEPAIGAGGAGGGKPPGGVVNVMGGREAPSRHTEAEAAEAAAAAEAQAAAEAEEQAKADEASDLAHEEEDGDEDGDGNEGDGGEEGLAEILQDQMAEA